MRLARAAAGADDELHLAVDALRADASRYLSPNDLDVRRLWRLADSLQAGKVVEASVAKADLSVLLGDRASVDRWLDNASKNRGRELSHLSRFCALYTLGYFSEAHDCYKDALMASVGDLAHPAMSGVKCAAFSAVIESFTPTESLKVDLAEVDLLAMEISQAAISLLRRLNVTESDVTAMLDVAGEVLRAEHLFEVNVVPGFAFVDSEEDAGLLYQIALDCDLDTADKLTDRVIELMIDRDLDKAGLGFSFVAAPKTAN